MLFFTTNRYRFFHKPELMVMDLNVHRGSGFVTYGAAESLSLLCVAQKVPLVFSSFCQTKKGFM